MTFRNNGKVRIQIGRLQNAARYWSGSPALHAEPTQTLMTTPDKRSDPILPLQRGAVEMASGLTDYELERDRRIAENKRKMEVCLLVTPGL
jgi:hypothetical protein